MKKNIYGAMLLLLLVIILSISASLVVSATDIVGKIDLPDDNKTYEAAPVTINSNGTSIQIDEANKIIISDTTNSGLAGLWSVRVVGDTSWSTPIYVEGSYSDRQDLMEPSEDGIKIEKNSGFVVGKVSYPKDFFNGAPYYPKAVYAWSDISTAQLASFINAANDEEKATAYADIKSIISNNAS